MNAVSKPTRELYSNLRSEIIRIHYRLQLVRRLFVSLDIVDLLYKTAPQFFRTLRIDLMDTIVIAISRFTDPAKSFNQFDNASLQQLIHSLDSNIYSDLIRSLTNILDQIKAKSSRIEKWRKKWAAHRDFAVVQGLIPMPATSLVEIDVVLTLLGSFMNEFESVCQDRNIEYVNDGTMPPEEFAHLISEGERLKIFPPTSYENIRFYPDDGNTIIELVKKADAYRNPG